MLCCDEKTQCRALERTQPGLPLGRGHIRTQTHDYIRHGTVTLFAALSYLEGKLIYRTEQQHTHVEWLRFLKQIDRETPEDVDLHLIADNYCTHKHGKVVSWLKKHQRFQMHFIPTSSSWMNMVERFFADLTAGRASSSRRASLPCAVPGAQGRPRTRGFLARNGSTRGDPPYPHLFQETQNPSTPSVS